MIKSKSTWADLMVFAGAMTVLCSVPIGIDTYYENRSDLHWAVIQTLVMTGSTAITGGMILCIAGHILKKRTKTIFVALLDEGVDVWRPVSALRMSEDVFRVLGKPPEGEHWRFIPGELVRCKEHTFADGRRGLVGQEKVDV